MLIFIILITLIFFLLISLKIHLPVFPFDNTKKVQSVNTQKIQLNLTLIILPLIFYYSNFQDIILFSIFFFIGFLDDKYGLDIKSRFIPLFSFLVIYFYFTNYVINFNFYSKDTYLFIKIFITIFFILGFIHTMNMIDGKNGFALLIYLNVAIFLIIKLYFLNEIELELIFISIALLLSMSLNLLNKSYLGNSGIILITMYFAFLLIGLYNESIISIKDIYTVLFLPFLDGLRVTFSRILSGKNVFNADKNHLHHKIKRWDLGIIFIFFSLFFMNSFNFFLDINLIATIITSLFFYFFLLFIFKKW